MQNRRQVSMLTPPPFGEKVDVKCCATWDGLGSKKAGRRSGDLSAGPKKSVEDNGNAGLAHPWLIHRGCANVGSPFRGNNPINAPG